RLEHAAEQLVPAQAVFVEVFVHFVNVAAFPELHQAMDAVDERHRPAAGSLIAHRAGATMIPRLELYLAAGTRFFGWLLLVAGLVFLIVVGLISTALDQNIPIPEQLLVRHTASRGVENTGPHRCIVHPEI